MSFDKKKFSLVIPIFNEVSNIGILVQEINEVLKNNFLFEIIIIDDCSNDGTTLMLKSDLFKDCVIKRNDSNKGQSKCIMTGVKIAKFDTIITLDGDLQNDPNDIPSLINIFFNETYNFKLVGGIRKKRKDSYIKKISSITANSLRKFILDDNCDDTGCGLKIFNKSIFLTFPFFDGIHRFLPALFKGYGYKTYFIEVNHRPRLSGISKYGTFTRLIWGIRDIIKVKKIIKKNRNSH